jgi:YidC/Oxa1 family membrane protein insertase
METQRTIFVGILFFLTYLLWNGWQQQFAPQVQAPSPIAAGLIDDAVARDQAERLPSTVPPSLKNASENRGPENRGLVEPDQSKIKNKELAIKTDVIHIAINQHGDITQAALLKYSNDKNDKNDKNLNSGLVLLDTGETDPSHINRVEMGIVKEKIIYALPSEEIVLKPDQKTLEVRLMGSNESHTLGVLKTLRLTAGEYAIGIDYAITNQASAPWSGNIYGILKRKKNTESRSIFGFSTFTGVALYDQAGKFQKRSPEDIQKHPQEWETHQGWIAMIQHYFLNALIPNDGDSYRYKTSYGADNIYSASMLGPELTILPKEMKKTGFVFYAGPEDAEQLKKLAPGLDRTIDYGILWPIAAFIFWVMKKIHVFFHNWGVAIILVTVLIKALFYRFSASSYRSMAKMKQLAPKLEKMKERYGEDKQKMSQAMMELYKTEKVNPLGGCLPIIVQIPFFIALYWVIMESVELRQAPFMLWISDLSERDPYFVLPLLMGLTMFIQQKLSPPATDPTQQKVMMLMPIVFTGLFLYFPAGLVLYWVVNNALSILQQWWITRSIAIKK